MPSDERLPQVAAVLHPALPDCPGHENWKRDFTGAAGLFSFELKAATRADRTAFVDRHGNGPISPSALRTLLSETRQRGLALENGETLYDSRVIVEYLINPLWKLDQLFDNPLPGIDVFVASQLAFACF